MAKGTTLGNAYIQVVPSTKGLQKSISDAFNTSGITQAGTSAGEKIGGGLTGALSKKITSLKNDLKKDLQELPGKAAKAAGKGILAGASAAAAGLVALTKSATEAYAEYEQLVGGSQLMFGDAYDYIADKAANAYATVQMSQNEYLQQVNGFATGLKTSLGDNAQAAAELADRIVTAEADVVAATGNSAENVQNAFNGIMKSNYTMLDNLQLGITPTKEGFQSLIDKVNDWNASNGKSTQYVISNLADCESALVDYIEMVGVAGYAHNEAMDTIQGSIAATKAAWTNLKIGLGDDSADIDKLVQNLVTSAGAAAKNVLPRVQKILHGIGDLVIELAPVVSSALPKFMADFLPELAKAAGQIVGNLVGYLASHVGEIVSLAWDMAKALINGIWDGIKSGLGSGKSTPKHRTGLDYVPYDGYVATLHRGEKVLTAQEASAYNKGTSGGSGGVTIVQNIQTRPQSPVETAAATKAYFEQARWAIA